MSLMNQDTYLKGFHLTYENARRLFDAAEALEHKKEFAIASSLLVLAAEEGAKAYTSLSQYLYPEKPIKDFDKSFSDHKHKLEAIRNFRGLLNIVKIFSDLYYTPIAKSIINPEKDLEKAREESFQNLFSALKSEAESDNSEIAKENIWWKHAKELKEKGFYVSLNKKNGQWKSPSSIKKQSYIITKSYVYDFLKQIELLYNLDFENPLIIEMIANLKSELKEVNSKSGEE